MEKNAENNKKTDWLIIYINADKLVFKLRKYLWSLWISKVENYKTKPNRNEQRTFRTVHIHLRWQSTKVNPQLETDQGSMQIEEDGGLPHWTLHPMSTIDLQSISSSYLPIHRLTSKKLSIIVVKYEVYYGYETIPGVCGCIKFNAPPRLCV